jgi:hypothetical protein
MTRVALKASAMTKPLEIWCDGGGRAVIKAPKNEHSRCDICGRILPITDGKIWAHRNIQEENRYAISEG